MAWWQPIQARRRRPLWALGALGWTPEYGQELSPAALVALRRENAVRHRLWRGQAEFILPLIDRARLRLCAHLTRTHGRGWPMRWDEPPSPEEAQAIQEDPLACG